MNKSYTIISCTIIARYFALGVILLFTFNGYSQPCTPPVGTISFQSAAVCQGSPANLVLTSATGQAPYSVVVNGVTYNNVAVGVPFGPVSSASISIVDNSFVPAVLGFPDNAVELGVKFRSSVGGFINGIRFYKDVINTGTHIGSLWSSTGSLLAQATFVAETASGWQEVLFNSPVPIQANTTYVASYFAPDGGYSLTLNHYASQSISNGPLTALQDGIDGSNGLFVYGGGFPTNSFNSSDYAVDVLFTSSVSDFTLTSITDANGCSNAGNLSSTSLTINPNPSGILALGPQTVCEGRPISLVFNAATGVGPFSITANSQVNSNISSGQEFTSTFLAAQPSPDSFSIWNSAVPTGVAPTLNDYDPVELGMKFRSATNGNVLGVRFYKRATSTGTHTGSVWTSSGTLLGTVTFTSETADGWQEAYFSTPIPVTANQLLVVSYFAPFGQYANTSDYFLNNSVTNGPLTAVDGAGPDGPNGLYLYSGTGGFPTNSSQNANYWVDVIFKANQGVNVINVTELADANGCTVTGAPIQSLQFASTQCVPLPVSLANFRVSVQQKDAKLDWETSSEINNRGFEVQRSLNGTYWQKVGYVSGAGNSTITQYYSFIDAALIPGKYYYRLKQIDENGEVKYSNVVSAEIRGGAQNALGQNYPNPVVQRNTTINYSIAAQSFVNITLYDLNGRVVKVLLNETKAAGQYILNSDLSILPAGTYYYKMRTTDFSDTKKLVISR